MLYYKLRVELKSGAKPVWRQMGLPDLPLNDCHTLVHAVMGWDNRIAHSLAFTSSSPFEFVINGRKFRKGSAEILPDDAAPADARLSDVLPGDCRRFRYEYLRVWQHTIDVLEMAENADDAHPHCFDGANACPPERVRNPGGYGLFLEYLNDRDDTVLLFDYPGMLADYGGRFLPHFFSEREANRRLGDAWRGCRSQASG